MSKSVEFFFDFNSPTAYLAFTQLPKIAADKHAEIIWRPFFLGGVMQATGNRPPGTVAAKGAHMMVDMRRFAKRYGVPLGSNKHFPMNTLPALRAATGLLGDPAFLPFIAAMYKASWIEGVDIGNPEVLAQVCAQAGIDAARIQALATAPENKEKLKATTDDAVARGAFGAPTFFVGEEMFFGQDRLDFVAEALGS